MKNRIEKLEEFDISDSVTPVGKFSLWRLISAIVYFISVFSITTALGVGFVSLFSY